MSPDPHAMKAAGGIESVGDATPLGLAGGVSSARRRRRGPRLDAGEGVAGWLVCEMSGQVLWGCNPVGIGGMVFPSSLEAQEFGLIPVRNVQAMATPLAGTIVKCRVEVAST